ncbi:MAG: hypothetical protein ACKOA8_17555 [Deltaproteobacteria bacterium]
MSHIPFSAPFRACAERADYASALKLNPETEWDVYFQCRAFCTLGKWTEFLSFEKSLSAKVRSPSVVLLLSCLKRLFGENKTEGVETELELLAREEDFCPYLKAEAHFMLGYLNNTTDRPGRAIQHHLKAKNFYAQGILPGPLSASLFNLCVAYLHLNEAELFFHQLESLSRLAQENSFPSVKSHHLRASALGLVDAGEYRAASVPLADLWDLYSKESRIWDLGGLTSVLAFCYLKMGQREKCQELIQNSFTYPLNPIHSALLLEWKFLSETPFVTSSDVSFLQKKWNQLQLSSPQKLNLLNVAAEKALSSQNYTVALRLCRNSQAFSIQKHQAPHLCDFRPIEIESLVKLGNDLAAEQLFTLYKNNRHFLAGEERQVREKKLEMMLTQMRTQFQENRKQSELFIDFLEHQVQLKSKTISLSKYPMIESFLSCLAQNQTPQPIEKIFQIVYQNEYRSEWHRHRVLSLIARTRKLLGRSEFIIHRKGLVYLNPKFSISITPFQVRRRNFFKELRQEQILKSLKSSQAPLSISQLENEFRVTRRTLQLDLEELLKNNLIKTKGNTRRRVYQLKFGEIA